MFGAKIKALRVEKGLRQQEFASQIGISQNHLSQIETNKRNPSVDLLIIIAKYFNSSIDDLIQSNTNPQEPAREA